MVFVLGIDIGSASSKGIVLGDQGPLGSFECPSGGDFKLTAERIRKELLSQTGYQQVIFPGLWLPDMDQNW